MNNLAKSYKLQEIGGSKETASQPSVSLPKAWVESIGAERGDRIFFDYTDGDPVATIRIEKQ